MEWVVILSVLVMTILCLLRFNVILSIIVAAITAGLLSGLNISDSIKMMVEGMGGAANTALSYILLGAFAVAISYTGITSLLVNFIIRILTGKKTMMLLALAGVASLSQNLVPVHIAFIPILIPPLLKVFDEMRMDRRAVATALTFGLKAPYIMIPAGYGLIFHGLIIDGLQNNGAEITANQTTMAMLIPGLGMVVGLLVAIFITYRKDKEPKEVREDVSSNAATQTESNITFEKKHVFTLVAIVLALIVQVIFDNLILGALTGLVALLLFVVIPFKEMDRVMTDGITMMGTISFVILIASGFANVLEQTGAVKSLVEVTQSIGDNQALIALVLLILGLFITIGIGTSFGTIPIIAALFVPICIAAGFSPMATAALVGTAGALGDAGSPASDSTLGPTSGLNADGNHNHIWDTCVPTFLHYNIPLFIFGWIAAMVL
ncbi:Na+/H+ antiporter family protein [Oceanobacillus sp. 1P07AA]|uniref:Na+/H+ antiporter family protein n=1 Tax=Oceanobacillus sp. 1P07AA TaxID=3132293 RepID=UPI0039A6FEC1